MRTPGRALIGSIASLALGGCLGESGQTTTTRPDSDGDGVPGSGDAYPTDD